MAMSVCLLSVTLGIPGKRFELGPPNLVSGTTSTPKALWPDMTSPLPIGSSLPFCKKTTWSNNTGTAWRKITKFCRTTLYTRSFRFLHRMTSLEFCCLCSNWKTISGTQAYISETIWVRTTKFRVMYDLDTFHLLTGNDVTCYFRPVQPFCKI